MKRLLLLPALALLSCGGMTAEGRRYSHNDLMLVTSYNAKNVCSCLFVMNQTEEYCRAWTRANPSLASFTVDWKAKAVESSALMMWGARAHWVSPRFGCVLD